MENQHILSSFGEWVHSKIPENTLSIDISVQGRAYFLNVLFILQQKCLKNKRKSWI